MNNKLEVIGIDHGWSMMKTISQVFVTGVKEITTRQQPREMQALKVQFMVFMRETISCIRTEQQVLYLKQGT